MQKRRTSLSTPGADGEDDASCCVTLGDDSGKTPVGTGMQISLLARNLGLFAIIVGCQTGCGSWLAVVPNGAIEQRIEGIAEEVSDTRSHILRVVSESWGMIDRPVVRSVSSSEPLVLHVDKSGGVRCVSRGSAVVTVQTRHGAARQRVQCDVKTCLVLSVGGFGALSQVGAVSELQRRGLTFDCVYGNSMGAVLGAIYAGAPERPLSHSFELLLGHYEALTRADVKEELSGLGIVKYAARRIVDKIRGQRTIIVPILSNDRLRRAVDRALDGRSFGKLPVAFATSHKRVTDEGPQLIVQRKGNVAAAVSSSANHPLLGGKLNLKRVDPGIDSLEAVPIAAACKFSGPASLFVLNASGGASVIPRGTTCGVTEVVLPVDGDKRSLVDGVLRKKAYFSGRQRVLAAFGP